MGSLIHSDGIDGHFKKYLCHDFTFNHQSLSLGLIVKQVGYLDAGPKYILNPRTLYHYAINFVSHGAGTFTCLGKHYNLQPGTAYFLFPGVMHSYTTDKHNLFSHWWIEFYGFNAKILIDSLGITPENPVIASIDLIKVFNETLSQTSQAPLSDSLAATCQLYRLFAILSSKTSLHQDDLCSIETGLTKPFISAKRFIDANFCENISMEEVAKTCGISSPYLIKLFKMTLGCPPSHYLSTLRLDSSKKMLLETNLTITEIAHANGFNDSHYFSRFFRKKVGYSPQQLREMTVTHKD